MGSPEKEQSKMKQSIVVIALMLASVISFAQSVWSDAFYSNYSYQTIADFKAINDTIVPERLDYKLLNAAIYFETNRQRALYGLKPLKHDTRLENCAQGHSQDMADYNFYSHTSTIPGKYTLPNRLARFGITGTTVGENIHDTYILKFNGEAYYPPSQAGYFKSLSGEPIPVHTYQSLAVDIVNGWMNSPGHKANILNTDFTHLGVGNAMHYTGIGIDRIPWVKSTQNFMKSNVSVFVSRPQRNPSTQNSALYTYSQSLNTNQEPVIKKQRKQLESILIGGGYAGIFNSVDDLKESNLNYQIFAILGGYWGKRGSGQNFWGVFPSVDLEKGNPFAIEGGTVLSRFLRLSTGARFLPTELYQSKTRIICPSATIGVQIHLGFLYAEVNLNGYYAEEMLKNRYIAAVGICF